MKFYEDNCEVINIYQGLEGGQSYEAKISNHETTLCAYPERDRGIH